MEKMHIKTGDTVIVLSGDSKGVVGEVVATSPAEGKVIVKGANIVSKHTKARRQGETSGIVKTEGAIYASNVQLVCKNAKCEKHNKGTRVKIERVSVEGRPDKIIRRCVKCGEEI